MATINRSQGNGNQNFKQIEGDSWRSIYLPAICAGTLMTVVLFMAVSCSKKSDKQVAKISPPSEPAAASPMPAPVAAIPATTKKLKKHHRPANATYVSGTYGVSFTYPWKYTLQTGTQQPAASVQTSFLKPGAVQIASVDMPDDSYPETDFSSAVLNVSVNQGLSAEECAQFVPDSRDGGTAKPEAVKLGANEFAKFEQINGIGDRKSDLKYFHLFKNNACYEFALDVETSTQPESDTVDHGKVFQKLERILNTAKIKDVQLPGTENTEKAALKDATTKDVTPEAAMQNEAPSSAATSALTPSASKADDSQSARPAATPSDKAEKAQVETPEQK